MHDRLVVINVEPNKIFVDFMSPFTDFRVGTTHLKAI